MKAVIIAAGSGSRLESRHNGIPKTLLKIGENRIIDIILNSIQQSGIRDVVVVTGYKAEVLEDYLTSSGPESVSIQFCRNPQWSLSNGVSVLTAEQAVEPDEEFILLMSDHIFEPEMLRITANTPLEHNQAVLAIDFKLSGIPDIDDGMKVKCERVDSSRYRITGLDKKFTDYQAIDCGMFKLNHSFFSVLRQSIQDGRDSLSDACNVYAGLGNMTGIDIGELQWIDMDTPEMFGFSDLIDRITAHMRGGGIL